ncbi:uroporphyrinogen decarboxylase family protein [Bacillus timonensis]|uniref:uroporphyrinogen decarboxylase family protein n=1 Tax=Bacillus timonensis TaxID=1033734 RepID=UPI0002892DD7|nr:uroporphyrinogen decarboxylase family protein [Bacillus timonensis]
MDKKELVQKFFKGRAVTRPPFLPLVGTYLTKVDQVSIPSILQDANTFYSALVNTQKLLGYDALILPADCSLEAEAFGGTVEWKDQEMPSVIKVPISQELLVGDFLERGRIPVVKEVVERLVKVQGKDLPIIATITGPVTILKTLYGSEINSDLALKKKRAEEIIQAMIGLCKAFGDAKVDGILINEDLLDPALWEECKDVYKPLFNVIKYYNIFGILRLSSSVDAFESSSYLPDVVLGSRKFIAITPSVKTKGIALPTSIWEENLELTQFVSLWKENKKRRMFLSSSQPLDLELNLNNLQEKIAMICNEENWL